MKKFVDVSDVLVAIGVFLLFVASYSLNEFFDPYTIYAPGVSLLFIPAGVKLLALLVARGPAIFGLFFASVYLSTGLWTELGYLSFYYFALVSVLTYSIAIYLVIKYFKVSKTLLNLRYLHIVLMALIACLLNGCFHNVVYMWQGVTSLEELWSKSLAMSLGDFMGCFVVVSIYNVILRSRSTFIS